MSVATVTAIGTISEGLTESLSGAASAALGSVSAVAWPVAAIVGAAEIGKLFGNIWNKNRSKIPNLNVKLAAAAQKVIDLNNDITTPAFTNAEAYLTDPDNIHKMDLINSVLKSDIQKSIQDITTNLGKFNTALFNQEKEWVTTLAIWHIAATDNSFYTLNKGDVDRLIDTYVASDVDTTPLVNLGTQSANALNSLIASVDDLYNRAAFIVAVLLDPSMRTPLPNEAQSLRDRLEGVRNDPVTIESLTETIPTLDQLAMYLMSKSASITRTKTREATKRRKKKRRKKRKLKKKKTKKKPPQMVQTMWINTQNSSKWIKKVEFTFPSKQSIDSDNKGTLRFYMKKGGVIRKVRVKRGTFSVIAVWSVGTKLGVGYRYWSQFNKAAIVNKKVFSYSLAIINAQDREIAIPIEMFEKRVKYR